MSRYSGLLNNFLAKDNVLALSFAIALSIVSQINIPFYPVDFTLQTFILSTVILYNSQIAFKSVFLYVGLGILGLPVFAGFANAMITFSGPSAGYVIGWLIATFIISKIKAEHKFFNLVIFNIIMFASGISVLHYLFGFTVYGAIYNGLIIFIIPELLKIGLAVLLYRYIK